ncbi:MAG TPA: hypothetical protein VLH39_00530 [Magnetospirillaceae bacterium]|nr:hypothetical protein [Magnetospirillaceae bacterium]
MAGQTDRRFAPRAAVWAAAAAFLMSLASAQSPLPIARAVLVRGTIPVRGVPFLPVNAIPALYGEYRWGQAEVRVWVVREELFLPREWSEIPVRAPAGVSARGYARPADPSDGGWRAFAVRTPELWIVVGFPEAVRETRFFLEVLVGRILFFFDRAGSFTDLSLPAVLEAGAPD